MMDNPDLSLQPWDERGRSLLDRLNTPAGKMYLGGPESPEKLDERHQRYLGYHLPGTSEMMLVVRAGVPIGAVCYWERETADYEVGWELVPGVQGRGVGATAVSLLLKRLKSARRHDFAFARPTPDNGASNGLCRKLGFTLSGVETLEYPKGQWSPHNIWRLDLATWPGEPAA